MAVASSRRMNRPAHVKGLARTGVTGVYWCDESDLEGRTDVRLVNVPVKVYSATEDHDVPLHQVHNKDGGRIRYQRICEIDGEVVPFADIDKAYDDGERTVVLTKEDLDSLPPRSSREIDVVEFVPSEQVDLLTLDRAYYLEPDSASPKAYVLLRKTLEQTDRTAIVRFSLRQKTRLAALRVAGDVLVLQTLLWADEVREAAFPALDEPVRISAKELEMSASLVDSFAADFDPSEFSDEYQDELRTSSRRSSRRATRSTRPRRSASTREESQGGEVIDLMEALRASVERSPCARGRARRMRAEERVASIAGEVARRPPRRRPAKSRTPKKRSREEGCEGVLTARPRSTAGRASPPVPGARVRASKTSGSSTRSRPPRVVDDVRPAAAAFFALRRSLR
jgi:DNA end-binding protein Ku